MIFAIDEKGNRVHIEETHVKNKYFCPCCGEELVLKKGNMRKHHFSHKSTLFCGDGWNYDFSDWHIGWQTKFDRRYQEVVKEYNGEKHRADILIEELKTVIEFQHSHLSPDEFDARNDFYKKLGYKIIWLFDMTKKFEDGNIKSHEDKEYIYKWSRPINTFNYLTDVKDSNLEIYFQFEDSENEDEIYIVKIVWIPDSGFEWFAIDKVIHDGNSFIDKFSLRKKIKEKTLSFDDLYDRLMLLYHKDHTYYLSRCPLSTSGMACNNAIDIPKERFSEIRPCSECEFAGYVGYHEYACYKRTKDLKIPTNAKILNIERYKNGYLKSIRYSYNNSLLSINLEPISNIF